jgi:translocation and assembly module TamB
MATTKNPALTMNIELDKIEANKLEGFLKGIVKETQGTFSGNLSAEGNPSNLKYTGNVHFSNLKFKVDTISTSFALQNEDVQIVNDKISFKNFNLSDELGNKGSLTGTVNISEMKNPSFDLQLTTKNFQLLNSTRKDNNLFYGKVLLNATIKIDGNLEMPVVNAQIGLKKGTQLTLIIPDTKVDIVERKGVVIFVNRGNPMDPITMTRKGEKNAQIAKSIDLSASLKVDPEAVFQIVIDERAGNMLEVEGDANLHLDISPNGIMSLTGSYKVAGGNYQMSLYNLVKRRFELKAGSTILWTGDPMGAKLDLTAIYNIKTSTSDLMSDQLAGADASQQSQYRQKLPFIVLLNIDGELLKPQISFAMDMPDNQKGALDGIIYARIKQLNDDEQELNKQVFSLLVLNRFAPTGASNNSGNESSDLARSSVSQLLSGQLNSLSGKYIKGLDLGVDLDSYSNYQDGTNNDGTQLGLNVKKKLFNDRVIVEVGSQVGLEGKPPTTDNNSSSSVIGDVSLEYLVTKDGRYRLRGFSKNDYDVIVEGQIVTTGGAVMYNREFDLFKELFKKPPPLAEEEKAEKKKERKKKSKDAVDLKKEEEIPATDSIKSK